MSSTKDSDVSIICGLGPSHEQQIGLPPDRTSHWFRPDTQERFQQHWNDPCTRQRLQELGWQDPHCITYKFNQQGFRCAEFDDRPSALAIGCSHTMGSGIGEHDTWPSVLGGMLGLHVWNLGIVASSLDCHFRMIDFYARRLKPKFVIHAVTSVYRLEIFHEDYWQSIIINGPQTERWQPYLKDYFLYDENSRTNARRNLLAIQQVCSEIDVPYFAVSINRLLEKKHRETARDLMHYGPAGHKRFATYMHDFIINHPHGAIDDNTRIRGS